jgi:23S rRNA-/tRNA-specific pseudouridylate synthase
MKDLERNSVQLVTIAEEEAGQRIDNYLLRVCKGVPKSHIYRILRSGEVRVNKGRIDQLYRLEAGDVVRIPPMCRQRITNVGTTDLVFLAICTPRFMPQAYEDIEDEVS